MTLISHSFLFSGVCVCVCVCIILLCHILCIVCTTTLPVVANKLHHHIVMNVSSTLTNTTIWFVAALCFIVDVRTYVRMDGHFYRVYYIISQEMT